MSSSRPSRPRRSSTPQDLLLSAQERLELERLETSLWVEATRYDRQHLESVLDPEFSEFGRSGRRYTKAEIIAAAPAPIPVELPLPGFRADLLAEDVALVTYVSVLRRDGAIERSNRSSLWRLGEVSWRLRFHQGTPIPD